MIDSILSIDTFEQQCFLIKCMLQSSSLEYNMKTIGIDFSNPLIVVNCLIILTSQAVWLKWN